MPYLIKRKIGYPDNKPEVTQKTKRHNDKWNKYYGDKRWKSLRNWYIRNHPLCESCLFKGRSVPAEEVHHIKEFSKGETIEEKFSLLLDPSNLMSVCRKCHMEIHGKKRTSIEQPLS